MSKEEDTNLCNSAELSEQFNLEQAAKELCLDHTVLNEFIISFLDSGEQDFVIPIQTAIHEQNFIKIKKEAHRLKGAAFNLRLNMIGNKAQELENKALNEDLTSCNRLLKIIKEAFIATRNNL